MSSSLIKKAVAVSSILSGILLLFGWTMNLERSSLLGAELVVAGYVLLIFALIGVYSAQQKQTGILGLLGFVFTIVATALFIPWGVMDIARLSGVAASTDWKMVEASGPTRVIGAIGGVGFIFGFLFTGITTVKTKVFSTWIGIVLIIASVMPMLHPVIGVGKLLVRIGALAFVAYGWEIWKFSSNEKINDN